MTLKDLLKKKDKIKNDGSASSQLSPSSSVPEFTFLRTTTTTQSIIEPPRFPGDPQPQRKSGQLLSPTDGVFGRLRRQSNAGSQGRGIATGGDAKGKHPHSDDERGSEQHKFHERLHLGRRRAVSSTNIPDMLPDVGDAVVARSEEEEAKWEKRATVLAKSRSVSGRPTPRIEVEEKGGGRQRSVSVAKPSDDADIQEAIRLHEAGNLEASTRMFEKLADPNGQNHALSQVLFGLALRHGWGCEPDPERAITYLSYAASNSAEIESMALSAGMKKGGAAKGELVLAMYELANCFRNGWGIKKDPVAAKQYYETAANLGDTDAMNEVAWCYLEGFGCKKDKFKAAQFLRLAEQKGSKTLGNTWIWKEKYNPK
ncbi:HCP-like protein [Westerdykella ornata]|uniref:HCP-like protein n=1 Tax=Westerdykella ornata TaxID=318751 RepID=A0A6A6J6W8_WESOR|nr:HCP-like protein [Westerdykella ornata]KAF2271964.1 HCP-like protein [Westerdykella ornata]